MDFVSRTTLLYALPLAVVLGVYLFRRARAHAGHAEQLRESREAGLTEPVSLHPVIDPARCIGSSACVSACPESAIGVVGGKAQLVDPAACIGHGACAASCPMEAIRLVFGTERRGIDIPEVKPDFESNVPGLYIAGELGGMGLIRKAVEQGRQAMDSIRGRGRSGEALDAVIVGAGPAGLAAGLGAIQHKLRYVLLEQESSLGGTVYHYPRNKIAMTAPVRLPLFGKMKFNEVSKEALLAFWQDIVKRANLRIRFNEPMQSIERSGGGFVVRTPRGSYQSRAVLLAVGRRGSPRKLGVPGEEQSKVVYRLVDAAQYRGRRVLVVGGGDSALEAALALSDERGTQVALSYRGKAFDRVKPKNRERLQQAGAAKRVQVLLESEVQSIGAREVALRANGGELKLPNDAVIVCAGGVLPTDLLRKVGIRFEEKRGTE
ncbi:MAG TPA: NAD(P)-binding domain-containing protein [Burkholderiales bacterium]|nr:NAD(P)-binding domain-containing protein [Burkholderiales bacterium]